MTLVEYGDYECSFCSEASRAVKNVQRDLGDRSDWSFAIFRSIVPTRKPNRRRKQRKRLRHRESSGRCTICCTTISEPLTIGIFGPLQNDSISISIASIET